MTVLLGILTLEYIHCYKIFYLFKVNENSYYSFHPHYKDPQKAKSTEKPKVLTIVIAIIIPMPPLTELYSGYIHRYYWMLCGLIIYATK